jgi:hypothetical protein
VPCSFPFRHLGSEVNECVKLTGSDDLHCPVAVHPVSREVEEWGKCQMDSCVYGTSEHFSCHDLNVCLSANEVSFSSCQDETACNPTVFNHNTKLNIKTPTKIRVAFKQMLVVTS